MLALNTNAHTLLFKAQNKTVIAHNNLPGQEICSIKNCNKQVLKLYNNIDHHTQSQNPAQINCKKYISLN
jgi:hypothetical protein